MAEARSRADWAQVSSLMALLANCNRDPKKGRPFRPSDFDPYALGDRRPDTFELTDMSDLKEAFTRLKG
jgi:hypothetical protein